MYDDLFRRIASTFGTSWLKKRPNGIERFEWVAVDKDGDVFAYEVKPEYGKYSDIWTNPNGSKWIYIGTLEGNILNWDEELFKIPNTNPTLEEELLS